MKKIISILIIICTLFAALSLTGCEVEKNELKETHELSAELISNIKYYMELSNSYIWRDIYTVGEEIDGIKSGTKKAYLITVDPDDYYFACAYYTPEHENESSNYCCMDSYTWIGFNSPSEIGEYSGDKKLVAAFQINKSLICENLANSEDKKTVEHFKYFSAELQNGFCISSAMRIEDSFIHVVKANNDFKYIPRDEDIEFFDSFNIVILENEYYIAETSHLIYWSGRRVDANLRSEFGEYYGDFMEVAIDGVYTEAITGENVGGTCYYTLFKLDDVKKIILK